MCDNEACPSPRPSTPPIPPFARPARPRPAAAPARARSRPAGREDQRFPAVLFLHGFPGAEKNVDVQRRLQAAGVASYSLHFSGAWGSEGYYRFSDLVPQAAAGLAFLASRPFVDARRLGVF